MKTKINFTNELCTSSLFYSTNLNYLKSILNVECKRMNWRHRYTRMHYTMTWRKKEKTNDTEPVCAVQC